MKSSPPPRRKVKEVRIPKIPDMLTPEPHMQGSSKKKTTKKGEEERGKNREKKTETVKDLFPPFHIQNLE